MISKFDEFLSDEFFRIEKLLKGDYGSEILLLILISKEDSLLNCLEKIDFKTVFDLVSKTPIDSNHEIIEIIQRSYEIALKDNQLLIQDEHLLMAILELKNTYPYLILKMLNLDLEKMEDNVLNYFEFNDNSYLINLTHLASTNSFNPFIGRVELIDKVIRIMSKKQKNNCMIIGSAGVGKSALVEGVVMKLLKQGSTITTYRLELSSLIAGTRYRGDLEERLVEVINKIKEEKAILFIDEVHNVVTKGEDNINILNTLKPILARNEIKCIGATTLDEYYEYIHKDKALLRRFQNVFIPEATKEETFTILNSIKSKYEEFYNIKYPKKILQEIINHCIFYPNRKFPDKAIDLLDEVGSFNYLNSKTVVSKKDIKKIVFESININNTYKLKKYTQLNLIYKVFTLGLESKKTIANISYVGKNFLSLITEVKHLFNITEEAIFEVDFELFDETSFQYLLTSTLKFPIFCVVINNFEKGSFYYQTKIKKILETGFVIDSKSNIVNFRNVLFILKQEIQKVDIGFNEYNKKTDLIDLVINDDTHQENNLKNFISKMKNIDIDVVVQSDLIDENLILKNLYKAYNLNKKSKYIVTKVKDDVLINNL